MTRRRSISMRTTPARGERPTPRPTPRTRAAIPIVDTDIAIADVDNANLQSATVTLTNAQAGDLITAGAMPPGITAVVAGNVVTLTGSASPAAYQSALRAITYRSTSEAPATVARTFNIVVSDGAASSATAVSTITVVAVNDPPTTTPVTLSAIAEDSGARLITQAQLLANAADPDGPTLNATGLSIASGGGTLIDNGNGTWSYTPDPDDDTAVSFSYTVTDGIASTAGTANLDITPVNDAPEVFTASPYETQRNTPLVFSTLAGNAVSVDDIDSGTLSVTLAATNGTLTLTQTTGLSFSTGDGTGDATMVFSGSLADINAALDGLSFAPTGGYLGPAGISVTASDGLAAPVSETIAIAVTTQPPRLDLQAGSPNQSATDDFSSGGYAGASGGAIPWSGDWIENDPEGANQSPSAGDVQIDAGRIQLGDPGSNNGNLAANRASIARAIDLSEYINATLAFDLSTSGNVDNADTYVVEISRDGGTTYAILQSYNNDPAIQGATQTVSLSGYESANTVIRFRLASNFAGNEFVYIDNVLVSGQPTGYATAYTENAAPVSIASSAIAITDADSTTLTGATITLTNAQAGDLLSVGALPGGISSSISGNVVTLSGTATLADYQTAIRAVGYSSTSENPSTVDRLVTVVTSGDFGASSNVATATISVAAVNDAPRIDDATWPRREQCQRHQRLQRQRFLHWRGYRC